MVNEACRKRTRGTGPPGPPMRGWSCLCSVNVFLLLCSAHSSVSQGQQWRRQDRFDQRRGQSPGVIAGPGVRACSLSVRHCCSRFAAQSTGRLGHEHCTSHLTQVHCTYCKSPRAHRTYLSTVRLGVPSFTSVHRPCHLPAAHRPRFPVLPLRFQLDAATPPRSRCLEC